MPIYIDNRGSGEEELYHLLKSKHLAVERQYIESGDIVFGDVRIERKTVSDLVNSVVGGNRHFWDQLEVLKNTYKTPLLIIEGRIDYKDRLVSGILMSIILGWKMPFISTYNTYDTAEFIEKLFTRYGSNRSKGYPPAAVIKAKSPKKVQWAMLQCVRGIGPATSAKILNLVDICQLARTDPKWLSGQIKGMGIKTATKLTEVFQYGTH